MTLCSEKKPHYSKVRAEVEALERMNKHNDAITILSKMHQFYPEDVWAYQKHAYLLAKKKRCYANAVELIQKCLKNALPNEQQLFVLNKLYADALGHVFGEEKRAATLFKSLIKSATGHEKIKILTSYADFCVRHDKLKEAQYIYMTILEKNPKDSRAIIDLARSYRMSMNYDRALETLDNTDVKDDPYALLERVRCFIELNDAQSANKNISAVRLAIEGTTKARNRHHADSVLRKLSVLEKATQALLGDWREVVSWAVVQQFEGPMIAVWKSIRESIKHDVGEALDYMVGILQLDMENQNLPYYMFFLVSNYNDNEKQLQERSAAIYELARNNFSAWVLKARYEKNVDIQLQLFDKSYSYAVDNEKRIERPILQWFLLSYAQSLRKVDKFDEAYLVLEEARSRWGLSNWEINFERALNLTKMGNFPEAFDILTYLNDIMPDDAIVLDQLGVCLRGMGKFEEALEIYIRKQGIHPDLHGAFGLARTLFDMGRHDESLEAFKIILQQNPNDIDSKFQIAEIYRMKGNLDEAEKYLSQIDKAQVFERGLSLYYLEKKLSELQREKLDQLTELEEAKKLSYLGTMATATAHELNQPVGIIRAALNSALLDLRDGVFEASEMLPLIQLVNGQAERLSKIIENFRSFARGDRIHRDKVDLNDVIKAALSTFEEQLRHRNIKLVVQYRESLPKPVAWANPYQLEEVIINLVTNARDALEGRKNPCIWVKVVRRRGGSCGFVIEDNGPGLPEEYRKKMFVPFVSTKSTEKGTGLGLYISRRITDNTGGRLKYKDREGGGASFTVELPPMKG